MNNLYIFSSSAGSGKTYSITQEYIALLLKQGRNETTYKNILAITFTNKASNEMKNEILKKFKLILNSNDNKELYDICLRANLFSENDSVEKKTKILKDAKNRLRTIFKYILHDYSFFSVSTIDSFFQKILRSFAHEIGINYNYELELDTDKIISDSIDILLKKAEDDKNLREKIFKIVDNSAEEGESWNFKKTLSSFIKFIFNSNYRNYETEYEEFFKNKEKEDSFWIKIKIIENEFKNLVEIQKEKLNSFLSENNINSEIFNNYKDKRNFIFRLIYICNEYDSKDFSFADIFKYCNDKEESIKYRTKTKEKISPEIINKLSDIYFELFYIFTQKYKDFKTIKIIGKNYFYAGLLYHIIEIINNYINDNGLFLITNVPIFLSEIVKNNNSSFVYEKMGTIYENYLIDEFQDTSQMQWDSLKPLIYESLSNNNKNIVVGDLKQSIYSWRGGNWELLAKKLEEEFKQESIFVDLNDNWRSGETIINFNNNFFKNASDNLYKYLDFPEILKYKTTKLIQEKIYSNIQQNYKNSNINDSFVNVNIIKKTGNGEKSSYKDKAIALLIKEIETIQELGVEAKDILILVRSNSDGNEIARKILLYSQTELAKENVKYDVISSTSLYIYQNYAIKLIIACLKYFKDKKDNLSKYEIKQYLLSQYPNYSIENYEKKLEELFNNNSIKLLYENIEDIIESFSLNSIEANVPYLISFRDLALDFEQKNSSCISTFLNYWEENGKKKNLRLSEEQNAITILSIHKAKGLAADYVFVPFCNWDLASEKNKELCLFQAPKISPFNFLPSWVVNSSNNLIESHFSDEYYFNKFRKTIESFNILYVAFTRAKRGLYIYSEDSTKKGEEKDITINSINKLIQISLSNNFRETNDNNIIYYEYLFGEKLSKNSNQKKVKINLVKEEYISKYDIYKPENKNPKEQIIIKSQFERGKIDIDSDSNIHQGIIFHNIFENIETINDIDKTIKKLYHKALIKKSNIDFYKKILLEKIGNEHIINWFNGSYNIITESEIISHKNKQLYRPDRVMYKQDKTKTILVDYKFGKIEKKSYITQIQNYANLLYDMKFQNISLYLWYVLENYLLQVKDGEIVEKINLK